MTAEDNKAVVRRFYKAFEENDLEALKDILAPELKAYNLNLQNREEHLQGIIIWNATFSETRFEVIDQIAEGDKVATHVIFRSLHNKADYQGVPPDGMPIEIGAVSIEIVRSGKIVERWVYSDRLGIMRQIGLLPQP